MLTLCIDGGSKEVYLDVIHCSCPAPRALLRSFKEYQGQLKIPTYKRTS